MAALHQFGVVRGIQFIGRGAFNAVEVAGESSGNVVEIMGLMGQVRHIGLMGLMGFVGLGKFSHQPPTKVGQQAAGDEIVESVGDIDGRTFEGGATQFRELSDDVFTLRSLSCLVNDRQLHADGARG